MLDACLPADLNDALVMIAVRECKERNGSVQQTFEESTGTTNLLSGKGRIDACQARMSDAVRADRDGRSSYLCQGRLIGNNLLTIRVSFHLPLRVATKSAGRHEDRAWKLVLGEFRKRVRDGTHECVIKCNCYRVPAREETAMPVSRHDIGMPCQDLQLTHEVLAPARR